MDCMFRFKRKVLFKQHEVVKFLTLAHADTTVFIHVKKKKKKKKKKKNVISQVIDVALLGYIMSINILSKLRK